MFAICPVFFLAPKRAIDRSYGSVIEGAEQRIAFGLCRPEKGRQSGRQIDEDRLDGGVIDASRQSSDEGWFAGGDVAFDLARRVVHSVQTGLVAMPPEPEK